MEFSEVVQQQYQPYLSRYLLEGWKTDRHYIKTLELQPNQLRATMDILDSYYPPETYYFSTVHAIPILYQFVIIYACWENQFPEKTGDVYLRSLTIDTPRMIQTQTNIVFDLQKVSLKKTKTWLFYVMNFGIGDRAFTGTIKYAVPQPKPPASP